jgi:hypothetical protein
MNSYGQPMSHAWTCEHLQAVPSGDRRGGFYAACRLGTAEDRLAWLSRHEVELQRLENLRAGLLAAIVETVPPIWEAKGVQMRAREAADLAAYEAATKEIARLQEVYLAAGSAYLAGAADELRELGLAQETVMELLRVTAELWRLQKHDGIPEYPREVMARFPEEVRRLVVPG